MNRLLLIIIVICVAVPYGVGRHDLTTYAYPENECDSDGIVTYQCYSMGAASWPGCPMELYIYPNYQCSIRESSTRVDYLGTWQSRGDTLFIYEMWAKEKPDVKPHLDSLIMENSPVLPYYIYGIVSQYRKTYWINYDNEEYYPYPANVSVLKILNYGASLEPIESAKGAYYRPEAQEFRYLPDIGGLRGWVDIDDIWEKRWVSWRKGTYEVIEVTRGLRSVATVTLRKGKVDYTIVKPTSYLPGRKPRLYDKADEEALCGWMDTVQVGRRYRFELQRPDYPADSLQHVPYLRTSGRSLYVSKLGRQNQASRQAYGYFFAKLIPKK